MQPFLSVVPSSLPDPPYPKDTRAKGWSLELSYERIEESDTWAITTQDLRPWLLMVWFTAWKQSTIASLPNNDEVIAARIGMPLKQFLVNKDVLLRGFYLCSDGRLYHRVMTEFVEKMLLAREKVSDRVRKYRDNKKQELSENVTRYQPVTTPLVTAPEPEPEPVLNISTTEITGNWEGVAKATRAPKGTRLPENWIASQELLDLAKQEGLSESRISIEINKFKDYWTAIPGQKGVKLNWEATFRNWIRRAAESAPRSNAQKPKPASVHGGFDKINYREGINDDGSF